MIDRSEFSERKYEARFKGAYNNFSLCHEISILVKYTYIRIRINIIFHVTCRLTTVSPGCPTV